GSRHVSDVNIPIVHEAINAEYPHENITKSDFFKKGKNLHIKYSNTLFPENVQRHEYRTNNKYLRYQIKKVESDTYELRQLSNTFNPTVIFQITCIRPQEQYDLDLFINDIKK